MLAVHAHPQQPASWPRIWSTEGELDLQERLSHLPFYAPHGFGGITEDVQAIIAKGPELLTKAVGILNSAGPYLDTITQVVQDPALPQIVTRIKVLQASAAAKPSTAAAPGAVPTKDAGISKLIPALDAAIFIDKHPAVKFAIDHPVLVGAGALLTIVGIGFGVGRLTKRCRIAKATKAVGRRSRRR